MATSQNDLSTRPEALRHGLVSRLAGVLLLFWGCFAAISLASYNWRDVPLNVVPANLSVANWFGMLGAWHAYGLLLPLGGAAWWVVLALFWLGGLMACGRSLRWRPAGLLVATVAGAGLLQRLRGPLGAWAGPEGVNIGGQPGGALGDWLAGGLLDPWLGAPGAGGLLTVLLTAGVVVAMGPRTLIELVFALRMRQRERRHCKLDEEQRLSREQQRLERDLEKQTRAQNREEAKRLREEAREAARQERESQRETRFANREELRLAREETDRAAAQRRDERVAAQRQAVAAERAERPSGSKPEPAPVKLPPTHFRLPSVDCLHPPPPFKPGTDDTAEKSRIIVRVLEEFGIPVAITDVVRGPVITRYELLPSPGIRVNKVTSYADDLQMALKAVSIRILTPIPGQGVMGIEVPNARARTVAIREIVESEAWRQECQRMALPLLLGQNVAGEELIIDLARMPHLLIAGATGSGKSACINAILTGLLLARTPEQMRMLLVDPKMVEFTPYTELPHLVAPVITDAKKVAVSLQWAIGEMNRRLKLFSRTGVRNIADFNARERAVQTSFLDDSGEASDAVPARLPYIVILIDEMADLMMLAQAEIENRIARLAQLSRAAGIHMILATQRPSVNIITGTIKANFPGRIAFQVTQKVDSRTILDAGGADALIGRGDMLFMNPQGSSLIRAQGAWVDDVEIRNVVNSLKAQGAPVYETSIKERLDKVPDSEPGEDGDGDGSEDGDGDEKLVRQALAVVRETRRATTSSLQRRLRIGYNRAAIAMEILEQRGYIGPANGNEPREILVDLEAEMSDSGEDGG